MRERWNNAGRRVHRRRHMRPVLRVFIVGATILGVLATSGTLVPTPRLVWNASASAPIGLYWRAAGAPLLGDLVLARAPLWARKLAAERGYLPFNVPVIKQVTGMAGNVVCASGDVISIDGRVVAYRLVSDEQGRSLPRWQGCETLDAGEAFLLMVDAADSFDGRYFGLTERHEIIGRLVPLWIR